MTTLEAARSAVIGIGTSVIDYLDRQVEAGEFDPLMAEPVAGTVQAAVEIAERGAADQRLLGALLMDVIDAGELIGYNQTVTPGIDIDLDAA